MNKNQRQLGYIGLNLLATCFLATGGIFVKLSALPPIATGFYRILFSIIALYPLVKIDLQSVKIDKKDLLLLLCGGAFLGLDLIAWNKAMYLTSMANANLLTNFVPFTIIPVSYFLYKKKVSKTFMVGLIVTFIGLIVLMLGKLDPSPENFKGDMLAFLASIFYAFFLLTVSDLRKRMYASTIMFISAFGGVIVLFIAMILSEGIQYPQSMVELIPLLALTVCSQIFGQGLLSYCIGKIDVVLSSVLLLIQPVVAAVYSYFIFEESIMFQEAIGIFIILIGIFYAKRGI
ncbi:MAG: DMT family transporter [Fusobacteriaceae bacterium]